MLEIKNAKRPELSGCKGFGFNAQINVTMKNNLIFSGPNQYAEQLGVVKMVESLGHSLVPFPCECNFTVGSNLGHQILDGYVHSYDQKTFYAGQQLIIKIGQLCLDFSTSYPQSRFEVKVVQTVKVEKIYF